MTRNPKKISANGVFVFLLLLINANILESGWILDAQWYWLLALTIPLQLISILVFRRRAQSAAKG